MNKASKRKNYGMSKWLAFSEPLDLLSSASGCCLLDRKRRRYIVYQIQTSPKNEAFFFTTDFFDQDDAIDSYESNEPRREILKNV